MLLNNISKHESVSYLLLPLGSKHKTHRIDNLLEVFNKPNYNSAASFHFLAGVFANLSLTPQGCQFFISDSTVDSVPRLCKIVCFTEHPDVIRRGGSISTLKNVALGLNMQGNALDHLFDPRINLIPYILLPLSGNEEYTLEEAEGMPDELQLLDSDKIRETDPKIREMLVDIILLLTGDIRSRNRLRKLNVYHVIKKLHLWEPHEHIQEKIENIVNMLMRDESEQLD
jgi:hypothetical protein